jgi:hypothetical protein
MMESHQVDASDDGQDRASGEDDAGRGVEKIMAYSERRDGAGVLWSPRRAAILAHNPNGSLEESTARE